MLSVDVGLNSQFEEILKKTKKEGKEDKEYREEYTVVRDDPKCALVACNGVIYCGYRKIFTLC